MTNDSYVKHAFEQVCREAVPPVGCFVSLYANVPYYGGPEEGGWWGSDVVLEAYQHCACEEEAQALKDQVDQLAKQLTKEAKDRYNQRCREECDWLEERGLDDSYLPEPDGPTTYFVSVEEKVGESESQGCRHYE